MTAPPEIRRIVLPNSLELLCHDDSRGYFGDYHRVRVLLTLSIPLEFRFFQDGEELREAKRLLPDPVIYRRSAEKMAVPSADLESVRSQLVEDLLRNAGEYLGSEQFPVRYIRAELIRNRSGKVRINEISVFRGE